MNDQFNEAAREFNEALARKCPECATANGTNYVTLTIDGRLMPCSDLTVRTTQYFLATNPTRPLTTDEVFEHVIIRALATASIVRCRPPRWFRLWQRRHEKAYAKREKMRTARYAARWEQAHLRGGK